MANKFKLDKMANAADKAMNEAIEIAANDAEQHFKKSFKDGGFTDNVLERWQPRRNQIFTGIARGKRNHPNTKPTLVGKKVLMNSIKKKRINNKKRILSSDLPYSAIHNEGGEIVKKEKRALMYYRELYTNLQSGNTVKRFAKRKGRNKATHAMEVFMKAHVIKMPKRKYMGNSSNLEKRTEAKIIAKVNTALMSV